MANVTITKKADFTGCPILSSGAPGIPVTIQEPSGGLLITCYLRSSSSLYATVNGSGSAVFPEAEIPARRNADEFPCGHIRTTAEQAADAANVSAVGTIAAKRSNMASALHTLVIPGGPWGAFATRTNEQKAITALAYLVLGDE